jgi:hypothetical protein
VNQPQPCLVERMMNDARYKKKYSQTCFHSLSPHQTVSKVDLELY